MLRKGVSDTSVELESSRPLIPPENGTLEVKPILTNFLQSNKLRLVEDYFRSSGQLQSKPTLMCHQDIASPRDTKIDFLVSAHIFVSMSLTTDSTGHDDTMTTKNKNSTFLQKEETSNILYKY